MRIAAIDIGSNSIHMIIVQVRSNQSFEVIDREKEMVRLGSREFSRRKLTDTAVTSALGVLGKFKQLAKSHNVDEIIASATSAVREAENGRKFISAIEKNTGIQARVISGSEEARGIHRAAIYGVDITDQTAIVLDIGGGSVEISLGTSADLKFAQSSKIGVIRLTEQFVHSDPISERDIRRMVKYVNDQIGETIEQVNRIGYDRLIGTSGTILSLGALTLGKNLAIGPEDLRNRRIDVKQIRELRRTLTKLTLAERLQIPGLDPRRADLAISGIILLDTILKKIKATEITLCDFALREGLALDYIQKNKTRIAIIEKHPNIRLRSAVELAERCNYWREHSEQVATLALSIFDQTRISHGLAEKERELLYVAALLHDIGVHISYGKHHKHSYYLIKHGDLRGFEPIEIEIMALTARYHRRGKPNNSHSEFNRLSSPLKRKVRTLGAILRVAESLDRSHQQSIQKISITCRPKDYLFHLTSHGDTELEAWAAQRNIRPLQEIFGRNVCFQVSRKSTQDKDLSSRENMKEHGTGRNLRMATTNPPRINHRLNKK